MYILNFLKLPKMVRLQLLKIDSLCYGVESKGIWSAQPFNCSKRCQGAAVDTLFDVPEEVDYEGMIFSIEDDYIVMLLERFLRENFAPKAGCSNPSLATFFAFSKNAILNGICSNKVGSGVSMHIQCH